ncbi:hypothetical protein ACQEU3_14825 [Spirillospora sp. CA-253888]
MSRHDVLCPACGSADTMREKLRGIDNYDTHEKADAEPVEADQWNCLRCDEVFYPHPCPECGAYKVEGARGVSGQPFERPNLMVTCRGCGATVPVHTDIVDSDSANG